VNKSVIVFIIIGIVFIGGTLSYFITTNFSEEPPKTPIKIALNVWSGYAYAFIAQEKGIFEKNGVDVELILSRDYTSANQQFNTGEVDGVFEVLTDTLFRTTEGLSSKVVHIVDYSETGDVIIGSVNTIEELRGQTIGIEGINTFSHIFVLRAIESFGMTEGDVFFKIVFASDVVKKLDDEVIQAGHTWEPGKSEALEKGYKVLANAGDFPYLITDVLVFNLNIIEERPDDIQKIVQSMFEALEFLEANPDEAIRIMAELTGMSEDAMSEGLEAILMTNLDENIKVMTPSNDPTLKNIIAEIAKFYMDRGQISYEPTFNDIIEPMFVKELR